ncbi:MAG: hypothetical protein IID58_13605 [Proteobacteria bacterium]|nr:hypothetical protein [Pseudomonadota bacterium]
MSGWRLTLTYVLTGAIIFGAIQLFGLWGAIGVLVFSIIGHWVYRLITGKPLPPLDG